MHIDCDLYAPMSSALEYFYPRLAPGGFLVVHDYSSLHWNGAEKAVDEFFADKPECVIPLPDGAGSVAIRKARSPGQGSNWMDRKRRSILGPAWAEAANGKLADLLGNGWSGPEAWGVWGVGDAHELHLVPPEKVSHGLALEFDVQAALIGSRTDQVVDVSVAGRNVESWTFSSTQNRSVRRLHIPAELVAPGQSGDAVVKVVFRPRSVMSVSEIAPHSGDNRPLGLGLHRIRLCDD